MFPTTCFPQAFHVKSFQSYEIFLFFRSTLLFFPKICVPLQSTSQKKDEAGEIKFDFGEMAEWSNAAVLKTVDLNGSGGSNPSLSAGKWLTGICEPLFLFSIPKNIPFFEFRSQAALGSSGKNLCGYEWICAERKLAFSRSTAKTPRPPS